MGSKWQLCYKLKLVEQQPVKTMLNKAVTTVSKLVTKIITVSDNDASHFTGTTQSQESNNLIGESSDNCRKLVEGADVMWHGSSFQTREVATVKAQLY